MRIRGLLLTASAGLLLYFVSAACLLRYALDPRVLPHVAGSASAATPLALRIRGDDGNALLVRRYGTPTRGCVVFFPGQHGLLPAYEQQFFPAFLAEGIGVLAVAYPGQNGAPGAPRLPEILQLATRTLAYAKTVCPGHRVVVYGRSLGAMVAACAAEKSDLNGVILESAAPSFSSAIRRQLNARWYLAPLGLLPISRLLAHDYSLAVALSKTRDTPVVVFQGTADHETPLADLPALDVPGHLQLVAVSGGTHSTTYLRAREQIVRTALSMLRAPGR